MDTQKALVRLLLGLGLISLALNVDAVKFPVAVGRPVEDLYMAKMYRSNIPSVFCDDSDCVYANGYTTDLNPNYAEVSFIEDEYTTGSAYYQAYQDESGFSFKKAFMFIAIIGTMLAIPALFVLVPAVGIVYTLNNDKKVI